jgi:antitoxin ParD1/3/4
VKNANWRDVEYADANLPNALRARRRKDALKLTALRLHVKAGVAALDRGDFTDVDDAEPETYLQECRGVQRGAEGRQVQRLD